VQKLGAVYVPIGFDYPKSRIETIIEDLKPAIVLATGDCLALFDGETVEVRDLEQAGGEALPTEKGQVFTKADPDDIAYIFYTSGTTGAPKGIAVSYRGLGFYVSAAINAYDITTTDIMPSIAKYSFSISLFELICPLAAGGSLLMLERDRIMNAGSLAAELKKVTLVHIGPSLWRRMLAYIRDHDAGEDAFSNLRHVSVGGDVAQPDLLEEMKRVFPKAEVWVIYGCTEIACMGCTYFVPRDRIVDKTYVGKPYAGMEILLLGEDDAPVAPGEKGEVCFTGAGLLSYYVNKPELTQQKRVERDGRLFFHTGDVGRLNTEGDLELLGRSDFQIKIRGLRIEPVEVETHLRRAPGVKEAVVAAVAPDEGGEKKLVGYIVQDDRQQASVRDIRTYLAVHLPDYMAPSIFVELEELPLNQNLKVDRKALPALSEVSILSDGEMVAPRNDIETRLAAIWRAELKLDEIGVTTSFFDAGGDSLLAINLLMEVENAFGMALSNDVFLRSATIEAMARIVSGEEMVERRDDIVELREGDGLPIFCLFGILTYRDFAAHLDTNRPVLCVAPTAEDDVFFQGDGDAIKAVFSNFKEVSDRYLDIIRARQPKGPYILAGHSWGGVVALEAARELRAAGETVDLVILFDSNEPMFYRRAFLSRRIKRSLLTPISTAMHIFRNWTRPKEGADLRKYTPNNSFRWLAKWHSSDGYQATLYDGKVVLFKAEDRREFGIDEKTLGWGDNLPNMEVYANPGDHHGILKAPNVAVMTRNLRDYFSRFGL